MISLDILNPVILSAFTKQITWLDASSRFALEELIETFYHTRERVLESLQELTDFQVAYSSTALSLWSISESITHLIYSQGFYHNKILEIATSQLPHMVEAARGFGEGARQNVPAKELRESMVKATAQIHTAIEATRNSHDPERMENSVFGMCNYKAWILLLLAHEIDHLRQIAAMRRQARTNA